MNKVKGIFDYSEEEIAAFGVAEPGDPVSFTFPEGFFKMANSLTFLPDTQSRIRSLYGLMTMVLYL